MYEYMHRVFIVSCGCGTWYLIIGEKHRSSMFQNKFQRRILGPKREEVIGGLNSCTVRIVVIFTLHLEYYYDDNMGGT
jgi:hypothetical protein